MYKSPITVNMMDELTKHFIEQTEDGIVAKVREVMHIDIDKEELLRALKYDRYQYEHGYANGRMDGHASGYKERDDEIVRCKDCVHRDPEDKRCDCGGHEWVIGKIVPVEDDWYCADGERKDGERDV